METYEDGFKNADDFILPTQMRNLTASIGFIDYLKGLAFEHNKPHFAGIADGIWQIISQIKFDREELSYESNQTHNPETAQF